MTSGHQYREKASRSWERLSAKQVSKIWSRSRLRFLSSILFHFTKLNTVSNFTIIQLYILLLQRLKISKCELKIRKNSNIILISFSVFHAVIIATRCLTKSGYIFSIVYKIFNSKATKWKRLLIKVEWSRYIPIKFSSRFFSSPCYDFWRIIRIYRLQNRITTHRCLSN